MKHDFPEIFELGTIGQSYLERDIDLITLDARDYLERLDPDPERGQFHEKPAILMTG